MPQPTSNKHHFTYKPYSATWLCFCSIQPLNGASSFSLLLVNSYSTLRLIFIEPSAWDIFHPLHLELGKPPVASTWGSGLAGGLSEGPGSSHIPR